MAILYCGKHYQQCSVRICLRIRLFLWEKGEYSNGKAPLYQCTHARAVPLQRKTLTHSRNNAWPISAHTQGTQSSFDISHTTISQSNTPYLVYMFADFLMVLISDHSLKLHQGLGTSCDVTAGYLKNNVIEGSCWVGHAKHSHVRRSWISDEEKTRKTSSLFQFYLKRTVGDRD